MQLRHRLHEQQVKTHLVGKGYVSASIIFREFELVAIERPGWVQVYEFVCEARTADGEEWDTLFGAMRDDQRSTTEIQFFESAPESDRLIQQWSEGLIRRQRKPPSDTELRLLKLFAVIITIAVFSGLVHWWRGA